LTAVERLARLELAARRSGCSIRLRDPHPWLTALVKLVGLIEMIGQTEKREEVRIEEVVEPGNSIT
jgi:hypothetical protein